jgi:hypothetical protein
LSIIKIANSLGKNSSVDQFPKEKVDESDVENFLDDLERYLQGFVSTF